MLFQDNNHPGCFNACGQSRRHYKNDAAYTITVLRHDLKKQNVKSNAPAKMELLSRFRLRIMFQNVTNYLILFVGILFISIMLAMAVGMPETLDYYKSMFQI